MYVDDKMIEGVRALEVRAGVGKVNELRLDLIVDKVDITMEGMIETSSLGDSFRKFVSGLPPDVDEIGDVE